MVTSSILGEIKTLKREIKSLKSENESLTKKSQSSVGINQKVFPVFIKNNLITIFTAIIKTRLLFQIIIFLEKSIFVSKIAIHS